MEPRRVLLAREQDRAVGQGGGVAAHLDELSRTPLTGEMNCTQAVSWAACTGSYTKFIQSAAANAFGAPLGITIVSYQLIPPSSGITSWMSGRSYCICTTSPDQRDARHEVAALQAADVLVAGEGADLTVVGGLLDHVQRLERAVLVDDARVVAEAEHDEPERVPHLREHRHTPAELGVEEVHDAADLATGEGGVVADAGDPGLPRQVERRP